MSDNKSSYGNIFKTTFLFGFVQAFNIVTKVAVNKVVAILLGAEGLGMISLFNSALMMLKSGCGLGIKQSAVRDVAEANKDDDFHKISKIIVVTNRVVLYTALFGLLVTIIGSPLLSRYSFGSLTYTMPFVILSIAVALNIYAEGQMAILTGMRKMKSLAMTNIIGSFIGMLFSIPFYYFFGKDGIVPSLIVAALCMFVTTKVYVNKIKIQNVRMTMRQVFRLATPMVQMGSVLMLAGFSGFAFDLLVSSFIRFEGGFETVGIYQAGATIISSYFGIILSAMTTDYYPRICSVNSNNEQLSDELNKQVSAGLIMIFPLAVCFVFLAPYFLTFLYSSEFVESTNYTDIAIIGTLITVLSNCMGMIFMAKMESKLYLVLVLGILISLVGVYVSMFHLFGLVGLGISYVLNGLISFIVYGAILRKRYGITVNRKILYLLLFEVVILLLSLFIREKISSVFIRIAFESIIFGSVCMFSISYLKNAMDINLLKIIKNKLYGYKK